MSNSNSCGNLGALISKLDWYKRDRDNPDAGCPVHVFESNNGTTKGLTYTENKKLIFCDDTPTYTFQFLEDGSDEEITEKTKKFNEDEEKRCYVGYDVEWQEYREPTKEAPPRLLSHQLYFAHHGYQKAVVILTDARFKENHFMDLIAQVVSNKSDSITRTYLSAHFSLAEGGWLIEERGYYDKLQKINDTIKDIETKSLIYAEDVFAINVINRIFVTKKNSDKPSKAIEKFQEPFDNFGDIDEFIENYLSPNDVKLIAGCATPHGAYYLFKSREIHLFEISEETEKFYKDAARYSLLPIIQKQRKVWKKFNYLETENVVTEKYNQLADVLQEVINDACANYYKIVEERFECFDDVIEDKSSFDKRNSVLFCFFVKSLLTLRRINNAVQEEEKKKRYEEKIESLVAIITRRARDGRKPKPQAHHQNFKISKQIHFVDSIGLNGSSLKSLGEIIGIKKEDINQDEYSKMESLRKDETERFLRYAIRDSIVTAEAFPWFAYKFLIELGLPFKAKITTYSAECFTNWFKNQTYKNLIKTVKDKRPLKTYATPQENYRYYLGWNKVEKKGKNGKTTKSWEPTLEMRQFARFYAGGWNAVFKVGSLGPCTYWDLKSAYPCALLMLKNDYDFSRRKILKTDHARKEALRMFASNDPFQIAGLKVQFAFKPEAEPMFPVRVDPTAIAPGVGGEGQQMIVYPKIGSTYVMFPEFFTALELDLLEHYTIISLETFETVDNTNKLSANIANLLEKRGQPGKKEIYKSVLNYAYGKFAEGISKTTTASGAKKTQRPGVMTCYPLAAYSTSVCRAAMGGLLNANNKSNGCYAITTDGFISPTMDFEELSKTRICIETDSKLKTINNTYQYIEAAYIADTSLFIKTRGYVLDGKDSDGEKCVKMARMGVQTRSFVSDDEFYDQEVVEFINILNAKEYIKSSGRSFEQLKRTEKEKGRTKKLDDPPVKTESLSRLSHSFDMKRIPKISTSLKTEPFEYGGVKIEHPVFDSEPLFDTDDFVFARKYITRNATVSDYVNFQNTFAKCDITFEPVEIIDFLNASIAEERESFAQSEIEEAFDDIPEAHE